MSSQQLEILVGQAQLLPPDEQLLLIKRIAETLIEAKTPPQKGEGLVRGKYKNKGFRQSTEEDFKLAEYHPTYEEYE